MSQFESLCKYLDVKNIGEVTWSHRTNSHELLMDAVQDARIHCIEGDIILDAAGVPVMAHPPQTESDVSFYTWITTIAEAGKGAKLDFKDPDAVLICLDFLREKKFSIPLLLNADILIGPGSDAVKFSAGKFIQQCEPLQEAILSVGWTSQCIPNAAYTESMVNEMIEVLNLSTQAVTFPIRIYYLEKSWDELQRLMRATNGTLTLWNNEHVSESTREWIRENTDPEKTFYDIVDYE